MNNLILWFHHLPCEPGQTDTYSEPAILDSIKLSVYQTEKQKTQDKPVYQGSFKQFLATKSLYDQVKDIRVYLPGSCILYQRLKVPSRSRNRVKQALPFLLEDYLLDDTQAYFFALGSINNGQCAVAIINRKLMDFLYQQFVQYKLPVSIMSSEAFMFADHLNSNQILVRCEQNQCFIIQDKELAYSTEPENIELFLTRQFNNNQQQDKSEKQASLENKPAEEITTENQQEIIFLESEANKQTGQNIKLLAERHHVKFVCRTLAENKQPVWSDGQYGINLLQDDYQLSHRKTNSLPYMKLLLALAVLWLLSQIVFMSVQWNYYKNETVRLEQELEQEFFNLFPDAKRLIDVRVQTLNRLNNLNSTQPDNQVFLSLLAKAGHVLKKFKGIEISNLRYRDQRLIIELHSRSFIFEPLKKQLSTVKGLDVREVSSSKDDKGVYTVISLQYKNKG